MKPKSTQRNKWKMDRVITFDIESYDWVNPVALGMYNGKNYQEFMGDNCVSEFMDEVMRRKYRNCRFVAHNGGNYDFGFILEYCINNDLDYRFLEKNNSVFYLTVYDNQDKPRHFQDSLELLMSSLGKLGPEFTGKDKGDFDVEKIDVLDKMREETKSEMMDYLKMDCKILYECLEEFTEIVKDLSGGKCKPQLTMGSTTTSMYQVKFMDGEIPQSWTPNTDKTVSENLEDYKESMEYDIRKSYYGGRTEVYKLEGENLNHYDVNSLFPYCYTRKQVPVGNPKRLRNSDSGVLDMTDYGGVVKINGIVPDIKIPVLPVRYTADKYEKVVFPTGEIRDKWYTLSEVRYALEIGALEDIEIQEAIISKYGKPFQEFGETLYRKKQSIDKHKEPARYWVVKLLLNSFYGKFALDRQQENYVKVDNPIEYMMENDTDLIPINDKMEQQGLFKEPDISKAKYIIPRIASEITAKARIEMHKWFRKAGYENVWYCDTDSIVTSETLPTGEDLGELDLENEIEKGYFLAPKVYAELTPEGQTRTKAKGMRDNPNPFYKFEKAYQDKIPELISSEWNTPKGVMASMKKDGKMVVDNQSRTLRKFDDKRNHISSKDSVPISI